MCQKHRCQGLLDKVSGSNTVEHVVVSSLKQSTNSSIWVAIGRSILLSFVPEINSDWVCNCRPAGIQDRRFWTQVMPLYNFCFLYRNFDLEVSPATRTNNFHVRVVSLKRLADSNMQRPPCLGNIPILGIHCLMRAHPDGIEPPLRYAINESFLSPCNF